jgi:hypothetical protein
MLAIKGIYQNGQFILSEKVPFTQPTTVIITFLEDEKATPPNRASDESPSFAVTRNPLLGLFAHEVELIDEITESALQARENSSLRYSDG